MNRDDQYLMTDKTQVQNNNHWRAIIAATATIGAVGIALGMGTQLISLLMAERDFSSSVIGYSGTVGGIATIIAAVFASKFAIRFGVVQSILTMMVVGALSFVGFYFFQSIEVWFILRFTLHFAMTIMFILSEFWVNSAAPHKKRGLVLAIYAITLGLGFTVGPTLLAKVGNQGFLPFGTGVGLIMLAAIPILIAWKLSPQFKDGEHSAFLPYVFAIPTATMAVFVYGAIQMGALTLITPFSLGIGYTSEQANHFMTYMALGNVVLLIPIGFISDRFRNKRYPLITCAVIGFIGTAFIPVIAHYHLFLSIDLFILGGVSAGLYTIGLSQIGSRLKGHDLAAANSAFIFCYGIGMLVGPTMIGTAMDLFHPFGFSMAMATFFALYIILVVIRMVQKLIRS